MTRSKKWILWLAVLPGAFIASLLIRFPLHLVLFFTLSSFVKPYPGLPERLLASFVDAGVFVWVGAAIAPEYRSRAATALFAVQMLSIAIVAGKLLGVTWIHSWIFWAELSMGAAGALFGYYIVRRKWGNLGTQPR